MTVQLLSEHWELIPTFFIAVISMSLDFGIPDDCPTLVAVEDLSDDESDSAWLASILRLPAVWILAHSGCNLTG